MWGLFGIECAEWNAGGSATATTSTTTLLSDDDVSSFQGLAVIGRVVVCSSSSSSKDDRQTDRGRKGGMDIHPQVLLLYMLTCEFFVVHYGCIGEGS